MTIGTVVHGEFHVGFPQNDDKGATLWSSIEQNLAHSLRSTKVGDVPPLFFWFFDS